MYKFRITLLALGFLCTAQVHALNGTWEGNNSTDFRDTGNWSSGTLPGAGETATLNSTAKKIKIIATAGGSLNLGTFEVNAPDFLFQNEVGGGSFFTFNGTGITGTERLSVTNNSPMAFISGTNAGRADFTNNDDLTFFANSQAENATVTNGTTGLLLLDARGNTFNLGALSGSGDVEVINGTATLSIGGLNSSDTFSGNFIDNATNVLTVTKVGTGTFTVTGLGHDYTGPTNINQGTVIFNGGFVGGGSLFTIAKGATLRGNSPVGAGIDGSIVNNGKLFPGTPTDPFGVLNVSMDYNSPGGTGDICFNISPTRANQLVFGGTATLTGSTGRIVSVTPGRYNVSLPLIFTGGPLTGDLGDPVGLPPLINGVFIKAGNNVFLRLTENSLSGLINSCPDANENDKAVANAFELFRERNTSFISNNDFNETIGLLNVIPNKVVLLSVMKAMQPIISQINAASNTVQNPLLTNPWATGGIVGQTIVVPTANSSTFTAKPFRPIMRDNAAGYHFAKATNTYHCPLQNTSAPCDSNFTETALTLQDTLGSHQRDHGRKAIAHNPKHGHLWFQGFGSKFDHDTTFRTLGFRGNQAGVMMGFDYQVDEDLLLGVAGGYKHSNLDVNLDIAHQSTETPFGSFWGLYKLGNYDLEGGLTYNRNSREAKRTIRGLGPTLVARHKNTGYTLIPHLAAAYNHWSGCDIHVRPFVAFDYLYLNENGYTENGANSLNLTVKSHSASTLQSSIGFMVDRHIKWVTGSIRPAFEVRYMNRSQLKKAKIVNAFSFAPQATFITTADSESQHRLGLGAEIAYEWCHGGIFKLRYSGDYGKNQKSHTGLISIGKSW